MGFKEKINLFEFDEYEEVDEPVRRQSEQMDTEQTETKSKDNVVSLTSIQQDAKMVLCEPQDYDETQELADYLKKRQSIVCEPATLRFANWTKSR